MHLSLQKTFSTLSWATQAVVLSGVDNFQQNALKRAKFWYLEGTLKQQLLTMSVKNSLSGSKEFWEGRFASISTLHCTGKQDFTARFPKFSTRLKPSKIQSLTEIQVILMDWAVRRNRNHFAATCAQCSACTEGGTFVTCRKPLLTCSGSCAGGNMNSSKQD